MKNKKEKTCPKVEVIICVKDHWKYLKNAIESVLNQTYINTSCTIVDDSSITNPPEFLKDYFRKIKYLKNRKNLGVCISRNIGVNSSVAGYFVFLDDDAVLDKEWISNTISFLEKNKNIGICTGKIIKRDEKKKLLAAGGGINAWLQTCDIGYGGNPDFINENYEILYGCSASMIVRKEAFNRVRGFDEILFWGCEDSDLCWRIRLAGFLNYFISDAISYHVEKGFSKSFGNRRGYFLFRGYLRLILKNCELITLIIRSPIIIAYILIYMFSNKFKFFNTIKAIGWNIKILPYTIEERQYIKRIRKISDGEILKIGKSLHYNYFENNSLEARLKRFKEFLKQN